MTNEQQGNLQGDDRHIAIGTSVTGSAVVTGDSNTVTITNNEIIQISADKIKTDQLITVSPYKGLKPFEPEDSDRFFGRDQFLRELISELEQTNFILLLGASGSGKSSVVRAGLIPLLQKNRVDNFDSLIFTPDLDPFESLYRNLPRRYKQSETQIARVSSDDTLSQVVNQLKPPKSFWLIFIDQFEELFTLSEPEKRDHFITSLVKLSQERTTDLLIKIVATMRADFLDQLDPFPANQLASLTQKHRPLITQMHPDELRLAIEQPAAHHGVVFETGLVEIIIKQVQGQAGYLPLLQYTLNLLWEQESQRNEFAQERTLRTQSYLDLGGVRGALQKHVDQIYESLSEPEQIAAQRIFLKLVEIGGDELAGTEWKPVRRRAARSEFNGETQKAVLDKLIKANLLVSDALDAGSGQRQPASLDATVEIAHEILLTSWETLSAWIKENRQAIALRNRLYDDVRLWINHGKRDDELWNGAKLERVNELRSNTTFNQALGGFSLEAVEFIESSNGLGKRQMQERIAAGDARRTAMMNLLEACTVNLLIPGQEGSNTGFFVAPGKILTCAPKILEAGAQSIKVSWLDQGSCNVNEATIDSILPSANLAILKLTHDSTHPCIYLDNTFQVDDPLCTYGYSHQVMKDGYGAGKCQQRTGKERHIIEFETYHNSLKLQSSPLLNLKTLKVCGIVQSTHNHSISARDQDDVTVGKATSTAAILSVINALKKEQRAFHKKDRRWSGLLSPRCKPRTVVLSSIGITGLVVLARFLKLLQPLELGFYDHLIQFRLAAKPDDKVLVVNVTDKDIDDQYKTGQSVIGSFSNETLAKVLEKVDRLQPVAIGLDIYRDNVPLNKHRDQELKRYFESAGSNLFTVCKTPYGDTEVPPPPHAHPDRVTFSDFSADGDGTIRRYTLAYKASQNEQTSSESKCTTNISLGLSLTNQYLKKQHGIELEGLKNGTNGTLLNNPEYCLKFTNNQGYEVIFPNFQRYMGGYQNVGGYTRCQMLINYQRMQLVGYSSENRENAEAVTVGDFLDNDFPIENYQNRVVLIGSLAYNTLKDYWKTPYTSSTGEDMPGVVIQAQIINQLINSVLPNSGKHSVIWVLPQWLGIQWGELLWIWGWSLAGGFLVWWWRSPRGAVMAIAIACTSGYVLCFFIFQLSSGWLPFIPVFVVLSLTGAIVYWLNGRSASRNIVETLKHNPQS